MELALLLKYSASACPSSPGIGIIETTRQIASTIRVNRIRCLSSGIRKQLANVFRIDLTISQS